MKIRQSELDWATQSEGRGVRPRDDTPSLGERIEELTYQSMHVSDSEEREKLRLAASKLRHEVSWGRAVLREMMAMSEGPDEIRQKFNSLSYLSDLKRRLNILSNWTVDNGLLSKEQVQSLPKLERHNETIKYHERQQRDLQALTEARDEIIAEADNEQRARAVYSRMRGGLSEGKLDAFVDELIGESLLPKGWRRGGRLASILRKMRSLVYENKMLDPRGENK